jgi:glycerol uptake facilitator-like aquaporin
MTGRAVLAETLGTALLVATVVGSGIMAAGLANGNLAVALLGNTLATAAILYVLITVLGPVSGAHFNPAVSLMFWLRGDLRLGQMVVYTLCQFAGGLIGMALAHSMFDQPLVQVSSVIRQGLHLSFSEWVASFGLGLTILGGLRYRPEAVAMLVGMYIAAGYWFTASTGFANPAVTLARSFSDSFSGIRLADVPFFMLAQYAGLLVALGVGRYLFSADSSAQD